MSHSNETPFPSTPIACLENKKGKEIKRKDGKKRRKKASCLIFRQKLEDHY